MGSWAIVVAMRFALNNALDILIRAAVIKTHYSDEGIFIIAQQNDSKHHISSEGSGTRGQYGRENSGDIHKCAHIN